VQAGSQASRLRHADDDAENCHQGQAADRPEHEDRP
jgi:hypothetical protein